MKSLLFKFSVFFVCLSTFCGSVVSFASFYFNLPNFSKDISYTLMLEDVDYEIINDNEVVIGLKTNAPIAPKIVIPDSLEIGGKYYSVNMLDSESFYNCSWLEEVEIPESVKYVCRGSFCDCVNLKTVIFRGDIRVIGAVAFLNCASLENVYFYGEVQKFLSDPFEDCKKLKEVFYYGTQNPEVMYNIFIESEDVLIHTIKDYAFNDFGGCPNITKDIWGHEFVEEFYDHYYCSDDYSDDYSDYYSDDFEDDFDVDF